MQNPFNYTNYDLALKARDMRIDTLKMLAVAKSGHTAAPLGMADVFSCIYFKLMAYDATNMLVDERDRFVLSCGHYCPILYVSLAHAGIISKDELPTLRSLHSRLQGHPHNLSCPGIENSSGPLGQGLSQAVGMALRAKLDHKDYKIFCVASDGENQEGQFWEAIMSAAAFKLDNLYFIIDNNNIEIDGLVEDIMPIQPLDRKYEAFNLDVFKMNGNNVDEIIYVMEESFATGGDGKPKIIITKTIPGYGVPFMAGKYEWHGKPPSQKEADEAIKCLLDESL